MVTQAPIVNLGGSQITDAGKVLGRAFWDDPAAIYIMPDDAARSEQLTWFMTNGARYGDLFGSVQTTAEKVEGAAIRDPIIGSRSSAADATAAAGNRREAREPGGVSAVASAICWSVKCADPMRLSKINSSFSCSQIARLTSSGAFTAAAPQQSRRLLI